MANALLNKLRGKKAPAGISPDEVARRIALSLSIAARKADRAQEEALNELVESLGYDVAKEVEPND